jgi:hypothetical protein
MPVLNVARPPVPRPRSRAAPKLEFALSGNVHCLVPHTLRLGAAHCDGGDAVITQLPISRRLETLMNQPKTWRRYGATTIEYCGQRQFLLHARACPGARGRLE